ncbi:hypothetical protein BJ508DRAFT_329299 [Ascobolus immersus RN42]|uniref:F-box domain-containing protein n=1 Tax=Ascobolus immersus RN42 TaxID=1160509 RepID=A0A3N4HXE4_ASCIM|nr:hypothetical protein BJ508DRAFT_329299 [Ascobolus immersus RN42]
MTRSSDTKKKRRNNHLLRLPTELLLEIYGYCSAFTLLQLSHTHPRLYAEINGFPQILQRTFGYGTSPMRFQKHSVRHTKRELLDQTARQELKDGPPILKDVNGCHAVLTIFHVVHLERKQERILFRKLFGRSSLVERPPALFCPFHGCIWVRWKCKETIYRAKDMIVRTGRYQVMVPGVWCCGYLKDERMRVEFGGCHDAAVDLLERYRYVYDYLD